MIGGNLGTCLWRPTNHSFCTMIYSFRTIASSSTTMCTRSVSNTWHRCSSMIRVSFRLWRGTSRRENGNTINRIESGSMRGYHSRSRAFRRPKWRGSHTRHFSTWLTLIDGWWWRGHTKVWRTSRECLRRWLDSSQQNYAIKDQTRWRKSREHEWTT